MNSLKKTITFKHPRLAEVLLKSFLKISYREFKERRIPKFIFVCEEHQLSPRKQINVLRGLSQDNSPETLMVDDRPFPSSSTLLISDLSNSSLSDLCNFLQFEPFMYELVKSAIYSLNTSNSYNITPEELEYLNHVNKLSKRNKVAELEDKVEDNKEYRYIVKEIHPKVVSKERRKKYGEEAKPLPIKRTVTLCLRINKDTGSYSIGHAICNHQVDKPTDLGELISTNRSRSYEHSLIYQKMGAMSTICFKPVLLSEDGQNNILNSLINDMEQNFPKYVAAYRN